VMQHGKLVEIGPVQDVFLSPKAEYTRNLLAAVPGTDLTVEIFGQSYRATVQPDAPLWDSENTRIRAQEV